MEPTNSTVKLLICDDHRAVTDALGFVMERTPGIDLVAPPIHDPLQAVRLAAEHQPDVVIMDLELNSDIDGLEGARRIRRQTARTRVIIFTANEDAALLVEAVEAGASGIVHKHEPIEAVVDAVFAVARGEPLIDAAVLARLMGEVADRRAQDRAIRSVFERLTERELEVLQLLGEGLGNEQMAARLFISTSTVQTHVRNILGKLEVGSRLEAVVLGARSGVISMR